MQFIEGSDPLRTPHRETVLPRRVIVKIISNKTNRPI